MTDLKEENRRLRAALYEISCNIHATAGDMRKTAEDTLKIVPFKVEETVHPDDALLVATKIHKDRADSLAKTIKTMIDFLKVWKRREIKNGNTKIAEAIQLTIDSYTCQK